MDDVELSAYVTARFVHLRRTAYLLCGDWHRAEDLVQTALAKVVVAARRRKVDNLDAYTKRALVRVFLSDSRLAWRRREQTLPVSADVASAVEDPTTALTMLAALRMLPARQRAVVVLRFWEDHSTEETAAMLGIAPGTVKSQTAKALAALRRSLADVHVELAVLGG